MKNLMTACTLFCISQLARGQVTIGNLLQFLFLTSYWPLLMENESLGSLIKRGFLTRLRFSAKNKICGDGLRIIF
jgi:hypothetical protein